MVWAILLAVASYLCLLFFYEFFNLSMTSVTQKNIREIQLLYQKKQGLSAKVEKLFERLASKITKKWNAEEERELVEKLKRSGIKISYENYLFQKFLLPVAIFLIAYLGSIAVYSLSPAFSYILRIVFLGLSIAVYFDVDNQIDRKLRELRTGIMIEMPGFLSTYRYSPSSKSLHQIIRDFKKNTTYLTYDLNLLEVDIDQYGTEKALRLFQQRVNILEVSEVVSILINDLNGDRRDSIVNVEILENKFLEKYQHYLEDKLRNRPFYLEVLNILAVSSILLLFLVCLVYQLVDSILQLTA